MSSITIRNLPEGTKENLARRAKAAGESLEAFLRRLLQSEASKIELDEDWPTFLTKLISDPLPPAQPGEKDAWEHSEELARNDQSIGNL